MPIMAGSSRAVNEINGMNRPCAFSVTLRKSLAPVHAIYTMYSESIARYGMYPDGTNMPVMYSSIVTEHIIPAYMSHLAFPASFPINRYVVYPVAKYVAKNCTNVIAAILNAVSMPESPRSFVKCRLAMNAASDAIPENSDSMFSAVLSSLPSVPEPVYAVSVSVHARFGNIMNLNIDSMPVFRIILVFICAKIL